MGIGALAEVVRLRNAAVGAGYALLGAYVAGGATQVATSPVLRSALVVLLVVASGNVINDYRDADADATAKPTRPIPSGRVSRAAAAWLFVALAGSASALALTLASPLGVFALTTIVVSVAYSYLLKNIPLLGNATVGLLCGATLLYGAWAAGGLTPAVAWAGAMTAVFVFAQEVFYTVEDEHGDRLTGVDTTATRLGTGTAVRIFNLLAALFVVVALAPWLHGVAPDRYLYAVLPCTVLPTMAAIGLLRRPRTTALIDRVSRLTRLIWFTSVVSVALLR
jgi:geranylgeranylglycerol-phosphate geranylgeranyltransferase